MSTPEGQVDQKVQALRHAFDASFAEPLAEAGGEQLDFIAVGIAGDPYALRLSEVRSLQADRRLVPAPSLLPELLGLAGFRGVLTPVYDLASLLGYTAKADARWLVVARSAAPIAFAFEAFESHLRVGLAEVSGAEAGARAALRGAVRRGAASIPVVHLPSLVEAIAQRVKALGPSQER